MCFEGPQEEHVFLIGDWGGRKPGVPVSCGLGKPGRVFLHGIDDRAQFLVAQQMSKHAVDTDPRYVLNVGDNSIASRTQAGPAFGRGYGGGAGRRRKRKGEGGIR